MVEQVTFQILFQFLQTVGILVGVYYYISTIRTNQRNQEIALKNQEPALKAQEHATETRQLRARDGVIGHWIKFEPIIRGFRERDGRPETWRWFEYLADKMKKVRERRGMPEYTMPWRPE